MEKAKRIFFLILAVVLPLIFSGTARVSVKPFVFSQIAIIFLSGAMMITAIPKLPTPVRLFYIWCVVTTFTSRLPRFSAISLMAIALLMLLYRAMVNSKPETLRFYKLIAMAVCIQVFWIFVQTMNRDFIMQLPRNINFIFGTLGNKNILAAFFLFSIPFVYMFRRWAVMLPMVGLTYCEASAAIFAMFGGIIFYLLFINFRKHACQRFGQRFMKFVVICGMIGCIFPAWNYVDNPFKGFVYGRLPIWKKTLDLMFAHKAAPPLTVQEPRNQGLKALQLRVKQFKLNYKGLKEDNTDARTRLASHIRIVNQKIKLLAKLTSIEEYKKAKAEEVWDVTLMEKIRNPWLGYGLGTFRFEFAARCTPEEAGGKQADKNGKLITDMFGDFVPIIWLRTHNTFLQFGRESGLPGMFFLLLIPGMAFAKFFRAPKTEVIVIFATGIFMICLNAFGGFPDRNYASMYYIMLTFAVFTKEVGNVKKLGVDRVSSCIARSYHSCLQGIASKIGFNKQK